MREFQSRAGGLVITGLPLTGRANGGAAVSQYTKLSQGMVRPTYCAGIENTVEVGGGGGGGEDGSRRREVAASAVGSGERRCGSLVLGGCGQEATATRTAAAVIGEGRREKGKYRRTSGTLETSRQRGGLESWICCKVRSGRPWDAHRIR